MGEEEPVDVVDYIDEIDKENNNEIKSGSNENGSSRSATSYKSFADLSLKPGLQQAITDVGFEFPSEVQSKCLPQAILGTDVICQAKSGMGKTAVFVLSILHQIPDNPPPHVLAVVLAHSRELAFQICSEFDRLKTHLSKDLKTATFYGGLSVKLNKNIIQNEKPQIIVGTPGRIWSLVEDNSLNLDKLQFFVLDECDQLLDSSIEMRTKVQKIFIKTPHNKQVLMLSATLSPNLSKLLRKFMRNPLEVYVPTEEGAMIPTLKQYYITLKETEKTQRLIGLLDKLDFNKCIVFVSSVKRADALHNILKEENFPTITINGAMGQTNRLNELQNLKEATKGAKIVIGTDLIARGIDLDKVDLVLNYDMPLPNEETFHERREKQKKEKFEARGGRRGGRGGKRGGGRGGGNPEPEAGGVEGKVDKEQVNPAGYLHRVGRAGRFGTKGLAISFVTSEGDKVVLKAITEKLGVQIPELPSEFTDNFIYV